MMWWILSGIFLISMMIYIGIYNSKKTSSSEFVAGISAIMLVVALMVAIFGSMTNFKFVAVFKQNKNYIENVVVDNENAIENAALSSKKIELNSKLFSAKYNKETFGLFSTYPDEVLELEPIE